MAMTDTVGKPDAVIRPIEMLEKTLGLKLLSIHHAINFDVLSMINIAYLFLYLGYIHMNFFSWGNQSMSL
jgi:hypothetical protein